MNLHPDRKKQITIEFTECNPQYVAEFKTKSAWQLRKSKTKKEKQTNKKSLNLPFLLTRAETHRSSKTKTTHHQLLAPLPSHCFSRQTNREEKEKPKTQTAKKTNKPTPNSVRTRQKQQKQRIKTNTFYHWSL